MNAAEEKTNEVNKIKGFDFCRFFSVHFIFGERVVRLARSSCSCAALRRSGFRFIGFSLFVRVRKYIYHDFWLRVGADVAAAPQRPNAIRFAKFVSFVRLNSNEARESEGKKLTSKITGISIYQIEIFEQRKRTTDAENEISKITYNHKVLI